MSYYIEYSTRIYNVYLKYIAPEDIHVYSIDEVFMDVTSYLGIYHMTPHELAMTMVRDVLKTTGITATAGIGTNMYLCKIAMDIVAKHMKPDRDGVRIAELDEMSYRRLLWNHTPITDFWRIGKGYAKKLNAKGMYTMGDVARCSVYNEDLLYRMFGINAELLIDHAWGWEPCTIADIKSYVPENRSLGSGQVLHCAYEFDKARLVMREMADALALDLLDKGLVADQIVLTVGYDTASTKSYKGAITEDRYGRRVPKRAHGSINLDTRTSSARLIINAATELFDRIVDRSLLIRRLNITANHTMREGDAAADSFEQLDLLTDYEQRDAERKSLEREKNKQRAILEIKKKFGKNAVVKGMDLQDGATAISRNGQVGGHKA